MEEARRSRNQYVWVPVDSSTFDTTFVRQNFGMSRILSTTIGTNYWEIAPSTTLDTKYMTQEDLNEVTAMYNSVKKYGGFYVARYEAGLDSKRTSNTTLITGTNVKSQMGKYIYNYIKQANSINDDAGGAVEVARSVYPVANTNCGVVSTLIYGVQWDVTVKWLLDIGVIESATNSISYGNYKDSIYSANDLNTGAQQSTNYGSSYSTALEKTSSQERILTTGALKTAITNNIYDMAGNVYEWTTEGLSTSSRVVRGGYYGGTGADFPIAYRRSYNSANSNLGYGFRFSLYIK